MSQYIDDSGPEESFLTNQYFMKRPCNFFDTCPFLYRFLKNVLNPATRHHSFLTEMILRRFQDETPKLLLATASSFCAICMSVFSGAMGIFWRMGTCYGSNMLRSFDRHSETTSVLAKCISEIVCSRLCFRCVCASR